MENNELSLEEKRAALINFWLLKSVSCWKPSDVYGFFGFAVKTAEDDDISVTWIFQQVAESFYTIEEHG